MTTWEYRRGTFTNSGLNDLGREGWEVYAVNTTKDSLGTTTTYYLRRSSDRYCEHCVKATQTMSGLEKLVP